MNIIKKTITMGDGTIVEIETGKLAKQAAGSVVVKVGGMMLLATVTCAKDAKEDVDFMPLSVEYKEKYAAAGRYPGGFLKREGRASDSEILVARLVDRNTPPQAVIPADSSRERAAPRILRFWWPVWWTGRCVRCSPMISTPRCSSMSS